MDYATEDEIKKYYGNITDLEEENEESNFII